MTTALLLATRLKVADPTAITALATLRTRLGFAELLAGLSREEVFLFEMDGGGEAARAAIERLVQRTNLFLNPNKHRHQLTAAGPEGGPGRGGRGAGAAAAQLPLWGTGAPAPAAAPARATAGAAAEPEAPGAFLLVWTAGDGEDLREALGRHALGGGIVALRRGWLWSFRPRPGIAPAELIARLGNGLDTRGSARGFLAHPAYQESRLYARRPGVYDVWEALLRPVGGAASDTL